MKGWLAAAAVAAALSTTASVTPLQSVKRGPSVIFTVLIDDLGFADTQVHNPDTPTPNIGALAREGVTLMHMHTYMYCSPTRRSMLSGRFPVHITGVQAPPCSNYLPLQMTLLPAKLKLAGFKGHMIGKGHLGYQTTNHLPIHRGFATHLGYLNGAENYEHGLARTCDIPSLVNMYPRPNPWTNPYSPPGQWPPNCTQPTCSKDKMDPCQYDMWHNDAGASQQLLDELFYSTTVYAGHAIQHIKEKQPDDGLYVHLTWQAVHGPYVPPDVPADQLINEGEPWYSNYCPPGVPRKPENFSPSMWSRCDFGSMLKVMDTGMGNITAELRARDLWTDTLMVVQSDNGGIGPGNNHPLRGSKMTPWQGGTRVMAMVTGGFLPPELRGTRNSALMHVADWYPTLCNLVGVDPTDTVNVLGAPRPIDGLDVWPLLLQNASSSPREYLPTTEHSIIWKERYKLYTSAGQVNWYPPARGYNATQISPAAGTWPCVGPKTPFINGKCAICTAQKPCLFDLSADEGERVNLAAKEPAIVKQLAAVLATYKPYVTGEMTAQELEGYECVDVGSKWPAPMLLHPWFGNFTAPCCRPKTNE